jgi:hypothetical protein
VKVIKKVSQGEDGEGRFRLKVKICNCRTIKLYSADAVPRIEESSNRYEIPGQEVLVHPYVRSEFGEVDCLEGWVSTKTADEGWDIMEQIID